MTFGKVGQFYGGILIRGLKKISPTTSLPFFNGPSLSVDILMASLSLPNVANFAMQVENKNIMLLSSPLHLEQRSMSHSYIYRGTRIGLSNRSMYFKNKLYRFSKALPSKIQNKEALARQACVDGRSKNDIKQDLGYQLRDC